MSYCPIGKPHCVVMHEQEVESQWAEVPPWRGLYLQKPCWEELADWRNLQRGILVEDNKRFTLPQDNFKLDRVFYTNHNNFIGCTVRDNHVV